MENKRCDNAFDWFIIGLFYSLFVLGLWLTHVDPQTGGAVGQLLLIIPVLVIGARLIADTDDED